MTPSTVSGATTFLRLVNEKNTGPKPSPMRSVPTTNECFPEKGPTEPIKRASREVYPTSASLGPIPGYTF